MQNWYAQLPEGYVEVKTVDAKGDKKTSVLLTLGSFVLAVVFIVPVILNLEIRIGSLYEIYGAGKVISGYLIFVAALFAYLVLHELVHGAAYKALTHQKLTFGMTLTVAFCGVPDIFTSRRTALISLAAPFTVFTLILGPLTIWLRSVNQLLYLGTGLLFAIHFGGCIGDLYMMYLLIFRYRDPRTLMNDTGPRQTIYVPSM